MGGLGLQIGASQCYLGEGQRRGATGAVSDYDYPVKARAAKSDLSDNRLSRARRQSFFHPHSILLPIVAPLVPTDAIELVNSRCSFDRGLSKMLLRLSCLQLPGSSMFFISSVLIFLRLLLFSTDDRLPLSAS